LVEGKPFRQYWRMDHEADYDEVCRLANSGDQIVVRLTSTSSPASRETDYVGRLKWVPVPGRIVKSNAETERSYARARAFEIAPSEYWKLLGTIRRCVVDRQGLAHTIWTKDELNRRRREDRWRRKQGRPSLRKEGR
jgi:hypothetical protein